MLESNELLKRGVKHFGIAYAPHQLGLCNQPWAAIFNFQVCIQKVILTPNPHPSTDA